MRQASIRASRRVASSAVMALLDVMMVLGAGSRRGTRLHALRLSLWSLALGLGIALGYPGCSDESITGRTEDADAETEVDDGDEAETDVTDEGPADAEDEEIEISCYFAGP